MKTILINFVPKRTLLTPYWLSVLCSIQLAGVHAKVEEITAGQEYKRTEVYKHGNKKATYELFYTKALLDTHYKINQGKTQKLDTKGSEMLGIGCVEYFKYYNKLNFSLKDDHFSVSLETGNHVNDIINNTRDAYPLHLFSYFGTGQDNLHSDRFEPFRPGQRLANEDPLLGTGDYFADTGKDLDKTDIASAFPETVRKLRSRYKNGYNIVAPAHIIAELLNTKTPEQLYDLYWSPAIQKKVNEGQRIQNIAKLLKDPYNIAAAIVFLGTSFTILKFADYLFKFIFDEISKSWNRPSFIVYMSVPRNFFERIKFYFFGKPTRLKDSWDKIILHPVIEKQRDKYYKMLKFVVKHNKKLTYKERLEGMGMELSFLFVSGPPGTGKTMLVEGLAEKAESEMEGYVNVITFSGSEASRVPGNQMITAMNEIYNIAEQSYLLNGTMTLVIMNEGDRFFGDRFSDNVSDARKDLTAKFLDMMPEGAHRFLVFIVASNLDTRNEDEARKTMDWAALDRFPYRIIFNKIEDDEEGRAILYQAFMLYLKETAKMIPIKIESSVAPYAKQNIERFTKEYNTPRKMKEFSSRIVKETATEMAGKKTKRKRLTQDHVMRAFEEEEERKQRAAESNFEWVKAGG